MMNLQMAGNIFLSIGVGKNSHVQKQQLLFRWQFFIISKASGGFTDELIKDLVCKAIVFPALDKLFVGTEGSFANYNENFKVEAGYVVTSSENSMCEGVLQILR